MLFQRIIITNFLSFKGTADIILDGKLIAVVGNNGSGKSNLFYAIAFLCGYSPSQLPGKPNISDLISFGCQSGSVQGFLKVELKRIVHLNQPEEFYINNELVNKTAYLIYLENLGLYADGISLATFRNALELLARNGAEEILGHVVQLSKLKEQIENLNQETHIWETVAEDVQYERRKFNTLKYRATKYKRELRLAYKNKESAAKLQMLTETRREIQEDLRAASEEWLALRQREPNRALESKRLALIKRLEQLNTELESHEDLIESSSSISSPDVSQYDITSPISFGMLLEQAKQREQSILAKIPSVLTKPPIPLVSPPKLGIIREQRNFQNQLEALQKDLQPLTLELSKRRQSAAFEEAIRNLKEGLPTIVHGFLKDKVRVTDLSLFAFKRLILGKYHDAVVVTSSDSVKYLEGVLAPLCLEKYRETTWLSLDSFQNVAPKTAELLESDPHIKNMVDHLFGDTIICRTPQQADASRYKGRVVICYPPCERYLGKINTFSKRDPMKNLSSEVLQKRVNSLENKIKNLKKAMEYHPFFKNTSDEVNRNQVPLTVDLEVHERMSLENTSTVRFNIQRLTQLQTELQDQLRETEEMLSRETENTPDSLTSLLQKISDLDRELSQVEVSVEELRLDRPSEPKIKEIEYNLEVALDNIERKKFPFRQLLQEERDKLYHVEVLERVVGNTFNENLNRFNKTIHRIYSFLTSTGDSNSSAKLITADPEFPFKMLNYRVMPPNKRVFDFRDLSLAEKSLASIAFLVALNVAVGFSLNIMDDIFGGMDAKNSHKVLRLLSHLDAQTMMSISREELGARANYIVGVYLDPEKYISRAITLSLDAECDL